MAGGWGGFPDGGEGVKCGVQLEAGCPDGCQGAAEEAGQVWEGEGKEEEVFEAPEVYEMA